MFGINDLKDVLNPIGNMLLQKNQDYGDSYKLLRDEYGVTAFHLRLADKFNRLKQVDRNGAKISESAEDTIKDIIGYCTLELLYRKNDGGTTK
ncbi:MAG: nucleotide modification associated domain-containing protein [Peptococcaceae bacterium]|jgi:hypothetical protein|nr:nucleotide modification associated domain-containing protein [Peptococcaceae bacterium]